MSWRDKPDIRDLAKYSKEHGLMMSIVYGVEEGAKSFRVITYGQTAALCKAASEAGSQLSDLVKAGTWPVYPDDSPLLTKLEERDRENSKLRKELIDTLDKIMRGYSLQERFDPDTNLRGWRGGNAGGYLCKVADRLVELGAWEMHSMGESECHCFFYRPIEKDNADNSCFNIL